MYLQQEFADVVFALGGSFMQGCELPEVGHVDHSTMKDQQLCHLQVTVGTGVVKRNQTSERETQSQTGDSSYRH